MKPELADFLTRLAAEPETLAAYTRNPDEAMTDAGLPAEIREALSSGDPLRVHQLVAPDPSPPEGPGQPSEVPDDADTSGAESAAVDQSAAAWQHSAAWQYYYQQLYLWWLATNPGAAYAAANDPNAMAWPHPGGVAPTPGPAGEAAPPDAGPPVDDDPGTEGDA